MESIIAQISVFRNLLRVNTVFYSTLVILLLISAFMLGRMSHFMESRPTFTFESKADEQKNYESERDSLFGKVSTSTIVASKTGKKYYFVWCKAAINIKESKKRYFDTEEQAQKAGYSIAANCK